MVLLLEQSWATLCIPKIEKKFDLLSIKIYLVPFNNVFYYLYQCIDIDRLKDLIDSLINLIFEISTETDKDIEQLISVIDW